VIGAIFLFAVLFAFPFGGFALQGNILAVAAVVLAIILPFLASIVGITLTIVVYDKVVLVEATSHHLLVSVLVNLIVNGTLIFNLVGFETRLSGGSLSPKLGECRAVRHVAKCYPCKLD
jgi:hypothetical protein